MFVLFLIILSCNHTPINVTTDDTVQEQTLIDTVWTSVDTLYLKHFIIPADGIVFDGLNDFGYERHVVEHRGKYIKFIHYWSNTCDFPRIQYAEDNTMGDVDSLFLIRYFKIN